MGEVPVTPEGQPKPTIELPVTPERYRISRQLLALDIQDILSRVLHTAGKKNALEAFDELGVSMIADRTAFPMGFLPNEGMDCFQYAVLPQAPAREEAGALEHMIGELDMITEKHTVRKGDIVLYGFVRKDKKFVPMHIGIVTDSQDNDSGSPKITVESKWGRNGDVFSHPLECVPVGYGNGVRFYRAENPLTPAGRLEFQS